MYRRLGSSPPVFFLHHSFSWSCSNLPMGKAKKRMKVEQSPSVGWFKHTKPLRTFSNYILTEIARYIEFFYTSSEWFDCTEPSP